MSEKEPVLFISDFNPVENKAEKSKIGVILLCLGVATLLPWNFYMSAYGYFMTKLKIEYPNEINNGFQGSECDRVKNRYQNAELCSCNNNTVVEALFNGEHIRDFEANSNMIEAIMNRIEQEDKFKIAEKQADNEQKKRTDLSSFLEHCVIVSYHVIRIHNVSHLQPTFCHEQILSAAASHLWSHRVLDMFSLYDSYDWP